MKEIRVTAHGADILPIDALIEFQGALKTITRANLDKLKRSILKHGFTAPIFVWKGVDYHILDGHQRLKALIELRQEGYNIPLLPVVYIDADSEEHAKEKLLYITSQYGDFTTEGFESFIDGMDFSFDDIRLTDGDFFSPDVPSEFEESNNEDEDDLYTKKIDGPIYEPKNEKPQVADLFDNDKCRRLTEEIQSSDIPDDDKAFLVEAAKRHIVFNYRNIADYYAHSGKDTQELMEKSGLVIIDFDKAIEYGYVKLSKDMAGYYGEDYPDE